MRNVYMVQVNYLYGNDIQIPYAVGAIAAYAWQNQKVKSNYKLAGILFLREKISQVLDKLVHPDVVAFSNYIWNFEYNKLLAKAIKEKYPECTIIFGGHQVSPDNSTLEEYDFIDYVIHDEGEEPFCLLLQALIGEMNMEDVPNISFRSGRKCILTKRLEFRDIYYPSPYTTGIFDEMISHTEYTFTAVLETNRGCPYTCSYCDWGCLKNKVRKFPMERIQADIMWFAEHQIHYIWCADANFGLFKRDEQIADLLIECKKTYGYPIKFRVNYTKNSDEFVYKINEKFNNADMSKGATLSFQSLNEEVLKNIHRQNIDIEYFKKLVAVYYAHKVPTYSEIILGLPGETYDSFCHGIGQLIDCGQHTSIFVFNCELLVNSIMGQKDYREKFGIRTLKIPLIQYHCEMSEDDICTEFSSIVVETNTMSRYEWIQCNIFSICVLCFHCLGLLQSLAIYVHYECHVDYDTFYKDLIRFFFAHEDSIGGRAFRKIYERLTSVIQGTAATWTENSKEYGNVTWPFEELVFLAVCKERDTFFEEIKPFILQYNIPEDILSDLLLFQQSGIKMPGKNEFSISLNYDFEKYFMNIFSGHYTKLEKHKNTLYYNCPPIPTSWEDFAIEIVWFGSRSGFNFQPVPKKVYDENALTGICP